ncbi:hypothetical protein P3T73_02110 [Kiritimatiellota bacterium B12222]|nr:hypothetical protein P3T73_02110 [Kiritimatiellota bacterium B12222]
MAPELSALVPPAPLGLLGGGAATYRARIDLLVEPGPGGPGFGESPRWGWVWEKAGWRKGNGD